MDSESTQLSTEQIISAVNELSLSELERVFERVLSLQAERKAPHLSAEEPALLSRAKEGPPADLRRRLSILKTKREEQSISDGEYAELTRLILQAEELHAERVEALVKLARLRGLALPVLMDQLGITFPENV